MARCSRIRKKKRQYCSGDLVDEITIQNRDITAPLAGTDFTETFSGDLVIMSAINTVSGKTYFDGVNTETNITHEIGFRYDNTITSESWIVFGGRRFDILKLENLDERSKWMQAHCVETGLVSKPASQA
jgi:head-tail adaptor